jgi:hypothetical protein
LLGQELEVLTEDKKHVVVRAPDGLSLKAPRLWTDVDGADGERDCSGDAVFTVDSLRALAVLLEALTQRGGAGHPERSGICDSVAR